MGEGYIEVSVSATGETTEALTDFLFSEGALGLVIEDPAEGPSEVLIRASFPKASSITPIIARLRQYQRALAALSLPNAESRIEVHEIPAKDWGQTWKEHFKPLFVGKRLIITPPWEAGPFPADRLLLRIEPAMSFGTGHHATTRMCLEALEAFMDEWYENRRPRILDMGTGTGILAIAAAALGAERVVALDTDHEACEAAVRNVALNNVTDRVRIIHGGVEALRPQMRFDLVLANLEAKSLSSLFATLRVLLGPKGRVVVSGILVEGEENVTTAARASGFRLLSRQSDGEWICLTIAPSFHEEADKKKNAA
ncbi:MAG: 50S ribosomal protein L11 methyltransferase [Candidatus Methylomirabilales bacterium]